MLQAMHVSRQCVHTVDEGAGLLDGKPLLPSAQLIQLQQRLLVIIRVVPSAVHDALQVQDRVQCDADRRIVLRQLVDACGERLALAELMRSWKRSSSFSSRRRCRSASTWAAVATTEAHGERSEVMQVVFKASRSGRVACEGDIAE